MNTVLDRYSTDSLIALAKRSHMSAWVMSAVAAFFAGALFEKSKLGPVPERLMLMVFTLLALTALIVLVMYWLLAKGILPILRQRCAGSQDN